MAIPKMEEFSLNGFAMGQREIVEAPSVVNRPLQESVDPTRRGCLFMAVKGQGAFQTALFPEGDC